MPVATADVLAGPAASADAIREGDVVARRFRIGRRLGVGGMGVVVAATDLEGGFEVALKFLRRDVDASSVERFLREARAAARLRNEHVTRVFDVGQLESGLPFIVMEQLRGKTLAEVAAAGTRLSVEDIARCGLHACEGLADAHAHGIVHRDLKPANLFLTTHPDGSPLLKVLDFGISKFLTDSIDVGVTTTDSIVGSPSFASPEQLLNPRTIGPAVDLWGLGVTLYFLLANELPFTGENRMQVCMLVLNSTPVPLDELRPDLPRALTDAVMRCLEKEPAARHADVAALARCLEPFAAPSSAGSADRIALLLSQGEPISKRTGVQASSQSVPPSDSLPVRSAAARSGPSDARARSLSRSVIALVSALALGAVVLAIVRPWPLSRASAQDRAALPQDEATPSSGASPPLEAPAANESSATADSAAILPRATPASTSPTKPRTSRPVGHDPRRDPKSYR